MSSGQSRLLEAARAHLEAHPDREPSTRELYETAGVAAPTLYHHFGAKAGLLQAVADEAFDSYLARKHAMPRTGDLLTDFATGWRLHIEFGIANPVLYSLMYGLNGDDASRAARTAEDELRRGLLVMHEAGLLQVDVEEGLAMTTAMAVGCVMQLVRGRRGSDDPLIGRLLTTLLAQLVGAEVQTQDLSGAVELVLRASASPSARFTPAESALLREWLGALADGVTGAGRDRDVPERPPETRTGA